MKKPKIFIACDTTNIVKIKKIISYSQTNKINKSQCQQQNKMDK